MSSPTPLVHPVHDRALRAARRGRGRQGRRRLMSPAPASSTAPAARRRRSPAGDAVAWRARRRPVGRPGARRRRPHDLADARAARAAGGRLVASIVLGSKAIPLGDVLQVLTGRRRRPRADRGIVEARVARTVVGLLVGAALAVAGAAMQGLTRNPLADPGLLGVNAGAGARRRRRDRGLRRRLAQRATSGGRWPAPASRPSLVHALAGLGGEA